MSTALPRSSGLLPRAGVRPPRPGWLLDDRLVQAVTAAGVVYLVGFLAASLLIPFAAVLYAVTVFVIRPQLAAGASAATLLPVAECLLTVLAAFVFVAYLSAARDLPADVHIVGASVIVQSVAYPVYVSAIAA